MRCYKNKKIIPTTTTKTGLQNTKNYNTQPWSNNVLLTSFLCSNVHFHSKLLKKYAEFRKHGLSLLKHYFLAKV